MEKKLIVPKETTQKDLEIIWNGSEPVNPGPELKTLSTGLQGLNGKAGNKDPINHPGVPGGWEFS